MSINSTINLHPLQIHRFKIPPPHFSSPVCGLLKTHWKRPFNFRCQPDGAQEDYLLDAPESVGDGFSFSGGKYSDGASPADDWFKQGKTVKAFAVGGQGEKAKDPIFGLKMASSSQVADDIFRKVIPTLSKNYHIVAFDWLVFGFSKKPQYKYGFDYTMEEYVASLGSLIDELGIDKVSLVVQGYFSPVVVKYDSTHKDKVNDLILLNPPVWFHQKNRGQSCSIKFKFELASRI